jgi:signal transduction histidine kinase
LEQAQRFHAHRETRVTRYIVGVSLSVVLALVVGYLLLRPPMADLAQLAMQLAATAVLSFIAGYAAYRWGWINRAPRLAYALIGIYVLATALSMFNVWISARLMFLNEHDLMLGTSLLVFAGGIAIALGAFLSDAVSERLERLRLFAADVTRGRLDARVPVSGQDEVADLARSLNVMAEQLEEGRRRQREMDAMRRELLAWVGHDLRTPLASVQAIVEALADGLVDDPAVTGRYLRTAQREIQALSSLIDDLFELAQIEAGGLTLHPRPNSMCDLVSDTIEGFSPLAAGSGVALTGMAAPDVDPVTMDAERIGRVLANLVSNALRHTPDGGTVRVDAVRDEAGVSVSVTDTGEGIPTEELDHLFERFHQSESTRDRSTGGSGLGLAIAKGIVEAHGGEIGVESTRGEGTRVRFRLPARRACGDEVTADSAR